METIHKKTWLEQNAEEYAKYIHAYDWLELVTINPEALGYLFHVPIEGIWDQLETHSYGRHIRNDEDIKILKQYTKPPIVHKEACQFILMHVLANEPPVAKLFCKSLKSEKDKELFTKVFIPFLKRREKIALTMSNVTYTILGDWVKEIIYVGWNLRDVEYMSMATETPDIISYEKEDKRAKLLRANELDIRN